MNNTNNYLKIGREVITFNDRDGISRRDAWDAAQRLQKDPTKIAIWRGSGLGHYPREKGDRVAHPVVTSLFKPISDRVRVVGWPFGAPTQID